MSKKKIKSYYILNRDGSWWKYNATEAAPWIMHTLELDKEKIEYKKGSLPVSQSHAVRRHLNRLHGEWIRSGKAK